MNNHNLELFSLSNDKQQLLLSIASLHKETELQQLIELIKQSQYATFKIEMNALKEAIKYLHQPLKQNQLIDIHTNIVIAMRVDAQLIIDVSDDKLIAKAQIITAYAGKDIDSNRFINELKKYNIKFGIIKPAIMLLIKKARQTTPGVSFQITIAKGVNAQNGTDTTFHSLIEAPKKKLADVMQEQYGSVNFQEIEKLLAVKPGDKLVRKILFKKGHQGKTVTGEYLTFVEGINIPFCINNNTAICCDDENLLIATAYGTPVTVDKSIMIEPVLIVQNVDSSSAPINHHGCLIIKGDVAPGSCINASGDITVIGFIESSTVKCGGNLYVYKGIIGDKIDEFSPQYTSHIECDGAIYTNFIQFSKVSAKSDLNINFQLIHSSVLCQGFINVKDKTGEKGVIFGGFLCSQKGINTVTLGATVGIQTTIDLIGPYHQLLDKKKQTLDSISDLKEKINNTINAQRKVNETDSNIHEKSLSKRLTLTIKDAKNQIERHNDNLNLLRLEIQQYLNNTQVTALKTIHSKVSVSIADDVFRTTQQYGATTLHIKNNQLIAESYQGIDNTTLASN
ncbi:DUF342 domain-containing protein [Psychromonas hadalis]|uniref:DUF342 domain-containing protein n=1 Tax=Psychromonas hadalis TaxID=211669 RepID=UPI0003B5953A|nr:FapA family protein [Psychromonas hadalis]